MTTPITMWRVNSPGKIEQVECSKVTDKSVFIVAEPNWKGEMHQHNKPQRESIASQYRSYHKTWADAHAHLLAKAERDVAAARFRLERAQGDRGRIQAMKPPADIAVITLGAEVSP
jgi:hypothetical protein